MTRHWVDVTLRSGKKVPHVEAGVCGSCGERYYDLKAMAKIEKALYGAASPRRVPAK